MVSGKMKKEVENKWKKQPLQQLEERNKKTWHLTLWRLTLAFDPVAFDSVAFDSVAFNYLAYLFSIMDMV